MAKPIIRPTPRIHRALTRMHISAAMAGEFLRRIRWEPYDDAAREVVRAAIQCRHRTRSWRNEMRTVLTN